jgi:hypothetical protein
VYTLGMDKNKTTLTAAEHKAHGYTVTRLELADKVLYGFEWTWTGARAHGFETAQQAQDAAESHRGDPRFDRPALWWTARQAA